ncbi:hypothetical protein A2U01_0048675, partial [Trifolium medium]|nr:hypothetical protein [Trifolium medium]
MTKEENLNSVVRPQEVPTTTLQESLMNEPGELDETDIMHTTSDGLGINPVQLNSKKEDHKKTPNRS